MIDKIVLSEQPLIHGKVEMPKGFEINNDQLIVDMYSSLYTKEKFPFSKNWDKLNTYIRDYVNLKYQLTLLNQHTNGHVFKPGYVSEPLMEADLNNLKHSPDFCLFYGIKVEQCFFRIYYDDNRVKNKHWDVELKNNHFIIFPSTNLYTIHNKQNYNLNYIQKINFIKE